MLQTRQQSESLGGALELAIEDFNSGARSFQSSLSTLVLGVEKEREELRKAREKLEKEREAFEYETHRVQEVRRGISRGG